MPSTLSRRGLLKFAAAALPMQTLTTWAQASAPYADAAGTSERRLPDDIFPSHPRELVREMVIVSHFNFARVKEMVEARPSLARAAFDWGFGDWEDALGAASHMGNRAIAEYLIANGARPSLFSAAMLGQLEVVKAFVAAQPGAQRIRGPHSISLLDHAKFGGPAAHATLEYLQSLGDAGPDHEAPLSSEDRLRILGTYVFGIVPSQQIDVTMEHNPMLKIDQLTWTRKGTFGRPLYHLGERAFYPAGAAAVRIRFVQDGENLMVTVHDPELMLTAHKRQETK